MEEKLLEGGWLPVVLASLPPGPRPELRSHCPGSPFGAISGVGGAGCTCSSGRPQTAPRLLVLNLLTGLAAALALLPEAGT